MNDLATTARQLPDNLPDLAKFALIGREKLIAVKAEIRAIQKVGLAKEVHEQKLKEAQEIAEAVLDAEAKIGELTKNIPTSSGGDRRSENFKSNNSVTFEKSKKQILEENNISKIQASRYEQLAKHPGIVEQVKQDAREKGEIPTRKEALDRISEENRRKWKETHKPAEEIVKERLEESEKAIQSGVVDFQTVKQHKNDKEFLENNESYEIWKTFEHLCREVEKFSKMDREKMLRAFRSAGMWGMSQKNDFSQFSLKYDLDLFTRCTNEIKAVMMEVIADD